jgi:hypothetical protein
MEIIYGNIFVETFLWKHFCGNIFVETFLWKHFCGNIFVETFLWKHFVETFCGNNHGNNYRIYEKY